MDHRRHARTLGSTRVNAGRSFSRSSLRHPIRHPREEGRSRFTQPCELGGESGDVNFVFVDTKPRVAREPKPRAAQPPERRPRSARSSL